MQNGCSISLFGRFRRPMVALSRPYRNQITAGVQWTTSAEDSSVTVGCDGIGRVSAGEGVERRVGMTAGDTQRVSVYRAARWGAEDAAVCCGIGRYWFDGPGRTHQGGVTFGRDRSTQGTEAR